MIRVSVCPVCPTCVGVPAAPPLCAEPCVLPVTGRLPVTRNLERCNHGCNCVTLLSHMYVVIDFLGLLSRPHTRQSRPRTAPGTPRAAAPRPRGAGRRRGCSVVRVPLYESYPPVPASEGVYDVTKN